MHALANFLRAASVCGIGLVLAGCNAIRPPGPPMSLSATPCPKEKCDLEITIVGDCKKKERFPSDPNTCPSAMRTTSCAGGLSRPAMNSTKEPV